MNYPSSLDHSRAASPSDKPAVQSNYNVAVSSRRATGGTMPTLRVTRLSDKRVIYPFVGCADMPLFPDAQSARDYAERYGASLVEGDIAVPE
ncbi:hypothetical protein ASG35_19755 [Burkholderia sp. Leaf177]|uniref:DUF6723 family protein n=1 Tax=Burkholderia sp. Leaf177 TaxID=1736287 RepID=UPI0006F65247|nr:DUF6723 family protein [Burkholderia sp. Leaf177]KQR74043.1 hypothetical protein ASG35_19755 [Burkholderia sp. Leaf177]